MTEALPVLIMCGLFVIPWLLKKQWAWAGFFGTVVVLLGVWELGMKLVTGQTLSQVFWDYSQAHPRTAIGIGVCITIAYIILLVHLFWKIGRNREEAA